MLGSNRVLGFLVLMQGLLGLLQKHAITLHWMVIQVDQALCFRPKNLPLLDYLNPPLQDSLNYLDLLHYIFQVVGSW